VLVQVYIKDYNCITQQVSNVVDDGYKINVSTSAEFKVFSPHQTYISKIEALTLGITQWVSGIAYE